MSFKIINCNKIIYTLLSFQFEFSPKIVLQNKVRFLNLAKTMKLDMAILPDAFKVFAVGPQGATTY